MGSGQTSGDESKSAKRGRNTAQGSGSVKPPISPPVPSVFANGRKYALVAPMVIGRAHSGCPSDDCMARGFWRQPDIAINDTQNYVSRHHAMVQVDSKGICWIEDLHSVNGTAILRVRTPADWRSPYHFERLQPGRGYKLLDGDIVALAHSASRGPYITITFRTT